MSSRRDDESLRSGGGPGRSTGQSSIRSTRHEPASVNSSSTNVSVRKKKTEMTPGERGSDYLAKIIAEAKEAKETEKIAEQNAESSRQNNSSGEKSRVKKLVNESRNGSMRGVPKTPMNAYMNDAESTMSGSLGAKAHSDVSKEPSLKWYVNRIS